MPIIIGPLGSQTWQRMPIYCKYQRGWTGRTPSAAKTGQALQKSYNHLVNWRYQGPMHMTSLPADSNYNENWHTGVFYIPVHYPPKTDAVTTTRRIAIVVRKWAQAAGAAASIKINTEGGGDTTLWSKTFDAAGNLAEGMNAYAEQTFFYDYEPPSGTNDSSFTWLELTTDNIYLACVGVWHVHDAYLSADQLPMKLNDFGPGRMITADTNSLGGMMEEQGLGIGVHNEENAERCTRRVLFNTSHPTGTKITGAQAYINVYGEWVFPARARDLDGSEDAVPSYPCFVVTTTGTGVGTNPKVKYTSGGDSWTWENPNSTNYSGKLINPWSTGVTGGAGTALDIKSASDDEVTIEFSAENGQTITLHNTSLFEGPPPNWT
ncbi:MAG: hypothetical protein GY851_09265 [bacterium]|nr:hypothetical protein [bacterium]